MPRLSAGGNAAPPGRAPAGVAGPLHASILASAVLLALSCGGSGNGSGITRGTITGRDTTISAARQLEPDPVPGSVRLFLSAPGVGFEDLPPGLPYSRVSRSAPDSGFVGNEGGPAGPWYGIAYHRVAGSSGSADAFATHRTVTSNLARIVSAGFGGRTTESFDLPGGGRLQAYRTGFTATGDGGDSFEGSMLAFDANGYVLVAFAVALPGEAPAAFERLAALVGGTRICIPGQTSGAEHVY